MADIKIMVDSAADLSKEQLEEYNIGIIPMLSVFDETAYAIGEEISNKEFYEKLEKAKKVPKTSQTPYARMYDILLGESEKHDTVIYITMSSAASGQNHTAQLVVEDILENGNKNADIKIVDSMLLSIPLGRMAIEAAGYVNEGFSADEICEKAIEYSKTWHPLILVNDLMYLQKGGRLKATSAILGTLLDVKPVLTLSGGLVDVEDKLRGKKKLARKLCELVREHDDFDENAGEFIVIHSDVEQGEELLETVKEEFETDNVMFSEFGPLIGTNLGSGAMAVVYKVKEN